LDGGDWISLAGVSVSAASAVWAVVSARRANAAERRAEHYQARAEQQAERAAMAAEEAAAAQAQSATAAKRSAEALEKQIRMAEEQAEQSEGVPWSIAFRTGSTYELWNESNTPKYHVHISGEGVLRDKAVARIDGRSSTDFMGLDASGVGDQVDVTWHRREDASDEPRQWSGNKPPKRR
jgi:ATPase subunit of ABC transporter with duplicated ATPase domains